MFDDIVDNDVPWGKQVAGCERCLTGGCRMGR